MPDEREEKHPVAVLFQQPVNASSEKAPFVVTRLTVASKPTTYFKRLARNGD